MSYFHKIRLNANRDINCGFKILRNSQSFISNNMMKLQNHIKDQQLRKYHLHPCNQYKNHYQAFKMKSFRFDLEMNRLAKAKSSLSTLSGKSIESEEGNPNILNDDSSHKMESPSKLSNDMNDTIHLHYPRLDSFSDEDKKQLATLLGISNLEIKNNSYTNTHMSLENNLFPPTIKTNKKKTNPNKKSYQQLQHRRKRVVPTTPTTTATTTTTTANNVDTTIPQHQSTTLIHDDIPLKLQSRYNNNLSSNEWIKKRIRVKSIHASRTIDIVSLISKVFTGKDLPKPLRYRFGKSSVIVQLPPILPDSIPSSSDERNKRPARMYPHENETISVRDAFPTKRKNSQSSLNQRQKFMESYSGKDVNGMDINDDRMRYIVAFRYGSVVFFNVAPTEAQMILQEIKKHSADPIATGFEQKEHFEVAICPGLDTQIQHNHQYTQNPNMNNANLFPNQPQMVNADYAIVKQLDMNNVAVISTIMAQTVAMDSYNITVDELLATFAKINTIVKKEGKFTEMEREALTQVVAMNNAIFIDMVSKLGVMDRSDTAWNFSQYENVFEEMQNEFEIYRRFENIEFKLNLIQENAKFFLTTFHSRQSNTLEWVIIVLIAFECVLMCLDMSGMGSAMFSSFSLDFLNPTDAGGNDVLIENTGATNNKSKD